jgi:3-hydroxymyristoyl/3-hydroxydecanoyl-(acyl carrier protein) dehydratase
MDGHFRAFSFVDRITALQPGAAIRGCYTIPSAVTSFPLSLVSEAVGQLAAWAAMAAVNFTHRPVAGIAGAVELLSEVRPGQLVELEAELQSVDNETVGYSGSGSVAGQPVIRLHDCVGPMLPVEEFDDPQKLRARFALLRAGGAAPGAFAGVPAPDLQYHDGAPGEVKRATLQVPGAEPFFADHFPRRNVFPGTLLMHASLETAAQLAREVPDGRARAWQPARVSDVKLRTFIPPGQTLTLEAKRTEQSNGSLHVLVETRNGPRLICSAEVRFVSQEPR